MTLRVLVVAGLLNPESAGLWEAVSAHADLDLHFAGTTRRPKWLNDVVHPSVMPVGTTHSLSPWPTRKKSHLWWIYPGLSALLRSLRPDLVHVLSEPWGLMVQQSMLFHRRVSIQGVETRYRQGSRIEDPLRLAVARLTLGRCAGYVGWTTLAVQQARSNGLRSSQPVAIVPAELPRAHREGSYERTRPPDERLRIGFAGRLVPEKGVDLLIRAVSELDRRSVRLTIAGTGPHELTLRTHAEVLRVACDWRGAVPQPEMSKFYRDIDVLVLPSRTEVHWEEQFGRVLLECMTRAIPVIASDCGAMPEVVADAGRLFPEGDVEALKTALESMRDPSYRRTIGERGRARAASRFDPRMLGNELMAFWRKCASFDWHDEHS